MPKPLQMSLLLWVAVILALSGCQHAPPYRPATVLITDAETKKPIPSAVINTRYSKLSSFDPFESPPENSTAKTGEDGVAHMKLLADRYSLHLPAEAVAPGYRPISIDFDAEKVRAADPSKSSPEPTFHFEMYASPAPVIELIVPDGYRGPLMVRMVHGGSTPRPGQRLFTYRFPASGIVDIDCTGILHFAWFEELRARYENGTDLTNLKNPDAIALRQVTGIYNPWDKQKKLFIVGTRQDREEAWQHCSVRRSATDTISDDERTEAWFNSRPAGGILQPPR